MARPQTRDEAATMAREAFTPEVWAAMQRIAEKRPEWAALWGAVPRGHVAALAIL